MADGDDADLDPRFDPRFQRGFDPERHPVPHEEPDAGADRSHSMDSDDDDHVDDSAVDPTAAAAPAATVPTGPVANPYLIWLWVVSIMLVASGAFYITRAAQNPAARFVASGAVGDVFDRTAWTIAPLALEIGLIATVGLVVWHSLSWARRRRES